MVFGEMQSAITKNDAKITRDKASCNVFNKTEVKTYTVVNDKCDINMNAKTTLPIGY